MIIYSAVDRFFLFLSQLGLVVCVLLNLVNAIGRYIFSFPIPGAYEFTENLLMTVIVFLSISYTWKAKNFVSVNFVFKKLPVVIQNIFNVFTLILGISFFLLIGYEGFSLTAEGIVNNQKFQGVIEWPTYLSTIWVPLGCLMVVLRMIGELIIQIKTFHFSDFKYLRKQSAK